MNKKYKNIIVTISIIVLLFVIYLFRASFSSLIDNGESVTVGSTLTYYLDVTYDGKDSEATVSSDTAVAKVYSDFILVEDKIPDGLTFTKFIGAEGSSEIGAVSKGDSSVSCPGYVVGGTTGLVYNSTTRTVSFKIKGLQAGCKLTVGIQTTVDKLSSFTRRDFYSVAYARENNFSRYSNTTYVFTGTPSLALHSVTYKYDDDSIIPDDAPELPSIQNYEPKVKVNLISEPVVPGYKFSGWSASNVSINSSSKSFIMPDEDVILVGSFSKTDQYTVSYSLSNDVKPSEYVLPDTKEYTLGDYFKVDILKSGDIINGYRFLGWNLSSLSGCISSDNSDADGSTICPVPSKNVTITGSFEKVQHSVTYEFRGDVLPTNASSLLPASGNYDYQDTVTLADSPTASGYRFLGWSESSTFSMPNNDVVVYGEWAVQAGTFAPDITIIASPSINDDFYSVGDVLSFTTTITNSESYDINDVVVENSLDNCIVTASSDYGVLNNKYITISSIPAGSSVDITSKYVVSEKEAYSIHELRMSIIGAFADNNYYLDDSTANSDSIVFKISNIKLKVKAVDSDNNNLNGYNFVLYRTSDLSDTPLESETLEFDKLDPEFTYYLKQTRAADGYVMSNKTVVINVGEDGKITADDVELNNENFLTTINVINNKINLLPQTGGVGNIPFILIGLGIIAISAVIYIIYLKKGCDKYA